MHIGQELEFLRQDPSGDRLVIDNQYFQGDPVGSGSHRWWRILSEKITGGHHLAAKGRAGALSGMNLSESARGRRADPLIGIGNPLTGEKRPSAKNTD